MNGVDKLVIKTFLTQLFSQFSYAAKKSEKKFTYPVDFYYSGGELSLKDGTRVQNFTEKTEEKDKDGGDKFKAIIKTLRYLCKKADNSTWMAIRLKNEQQFYCNFSSGYSYKNYDDDNKGNGR